MSMSINLFNLLIKYKNENEQIKSHNEELKIRITQLERKLKRRNIFRYIKLFFKKSL